MKPVGTVCKAVILLLGLALLVAGSAWAQAEPQQSLGDIARKQREKKGQEEPKGKKTLTNDDLPHSGGISSTSSASSAAPAAGSQASAEPGGAAPAEGEPKAEARSEETGMTAAEEADAAKKKLEMLKADEGSYKRGISRFEEMVANETDESRRELYRNAMKHGQEKLTENLQQQADAEKDLAAKEAAAKRAQPPQEPPPQ